MTHDVFIDESLEVRDALATDASEIARLLAQLGHTRPPGGDVERLTAFLTSGEQALVATRTRPGREASILGVLTLHVTPLLHRPGPIGRITALVVDEGARGQGVGGALVNAAEARFAARGCVLVEVTSNQRRTDAHAFYERLGYTATSLRFGKQLTPPG